MPPSCFLERASDVLVIRGFRAGEPKNTVVYLKIDPSLTQRLEDVRFGRGILLKGVEHLDVLGLSERFILSKYGETEEKQ
jgi:hypothetical protein